MLRNLPAQISGILNGRYTVFVVVVLGTLIRFYNLDGKQLWSDEVIQILHSTPNNFIGILEGVTKDRGGVPLDYLVQHFVLEVFGVSEFTARLHAAVLGSLAIPLLYVLAKFIAEREVAVAATILFAAYPLHHHYSQEGRPYALFTFLTISVFLLFLYTLRENKGWLWICFTLLTAVSFYAAYYTMFVVLAQTAFTGYLYLSSNSTPVFRTEVDLRLLARYIISMAAAAILFLPWVYFGVDTIQGYEPSPEKFDLRLGSRIIKEFSDGSFLLSLLFIVLGVFGVRSLVKEKSHGRLAPLLLWGVMPLLFILVLLWVKEYFFAIRQVLFMTPALFILMALGAVQRPKPIGGDGSGLAIARSTVFVLAVIVSLVVIALHLDDRRPDFRGAGDYVSSNVTDGDVIVAPGGRLAMAYYHPGLAARIKIADEFCDYACLFATGGAVFLIDSDNMTEKEKAAVHTALRSAELRSVETATLQSVRVNKLVPAR